MELTSDELDEFYRFFRVSGMYHCETGQGAWKIGNQAVAAEGTPLDSQNNVLLRMIDWVENSVCFITLLRFSYLPVTMGSGR